MWDSEFATAQQAAQESGKILNDLFRKIIHITKKGEIDLLTEADLKSEEIILQIIGRNFPQDDILAEEAGEYQQGSGRRWIIDPLDGTTNYVHGFPFFAVSIALQVENEVVLGVVFNPYLNEFFEARKGFGAFLNRSPIQVSRTGDLKESLIATGFPYSIYRDPKGVIDLFRKITVLAQGIRRPGSAAIDLCYVAAGIFDGFWEEGLKPWDTAAGSLIVKEAAGEVLDYNGNAFTPFKKNIVASNPYIISEMLKALNS